MGWFERKRVLAAGFVAGLSALGLSSCTPHGDGPDPTPAPRQLALAYGLHASYHQWDESWAARNFKHPEKVRSLLEWLHARTGDCAQPTLFWVRDLRNGNYARFLYECERGQFEAGWVLEGPYAVEMRRFYIGMRGAEPSPELRRAAEAALGLLDSWDRDAADALFTETWDLDKVEGKLAEIRDERGTCTLGPTDLANERGALWFLDCEEGPALMKVALSDDDRVRTFFIRDRRTERPEP